MNHSGAGRHRGAVSYGELDAMTAEVLPQRVAMSANVFTPVPPAFHASGPHTEVFYACQQTQSAGTAGLLNTGLLAQAPHSSMTCVPGVVHARH
jgi:hypothetical protein